MSNSEARNTTRHCEILIHDGAIPEADADISGNGVVLAFLISAYITLAVSVLAYIAGFVDASLLSPVDRRVFHVRPYRAKHPHLHDTVRKAVLVLGDQQIVTGIAILGAGFEGLRTGGISVYHFQIVLYLAWMSSSVHLSALTLLGAFLRRRKGLLVWRLSGMLVLLVLLLVGLAPTLSNDWGIQHWASMKPGYSGWGIPALCFWGRLWGEGVSPDAILGFVLLIVSYMWKVGALFKTARTKYNGWIRYVVEDQIISILTWPARSYVEHRSIAKLWTFRLLLSFALPTFAIMESAASFLASLWLSVLGLVFGTLQVIIPREQVAVYTAQQEYTWGFGQLVPLILLVQPIGAVVENLWTKDEDTESLFGLAEAVSEDGSATERSTHSFDTLLQLLSTHEPTQKITDDKRADIKTLLFESKLFAALVWIVQAAMATVFVIVFWYDAFTIGYVRTHPWTPIIETIFGYVALGIAATFFCGPWSRLARSMQRAEWSERERKGRSNSSTDEPKSAGIAEEMVGNE